MSQLFYRLLAVALMVLIGGCDPKLLPGGGSPGTGLPRDGVSQTIPFITGQLVDGAGQPVEGAAVRAYVAPYRIEGLSTEPVAAVETTTDAQGAFKLASPPLGSVAVEASGHGQKALRTGVMVKSGATLELGTLALQPTGRIAGRVTSSTGVSLLGTDVFIPGTDYLAKTAADGTYLIQDVPVGTYQLAAVRPSYQPRVLEGIQVLSGQTTVPGDLELTLDAPVLTSMNPQSGGVGTKVALRGQNFGASKHSTLQVTFGDTLATTVRRLSDTEIEAVVPTGATSVGVVVRSNGVASTPLSFRIVSSLLIVPRNTGLFPEGTASFRFEARDERGESIASPFVTWALSEPAIGSLDAQGNFAAIGTGVAAVTLSSGLQMTRAWVGVTPFVLTTFAGNGLTGGPQEGALAASQAFGSPSGMVADAAGNVYVALGASRRIWRIAPDGRMSLVAGSGEAGYAGDGGLATEAGFGSRLSLALDDRNRLWIADGLNHVVRFIPLDSRDEASGWLAGHIYRAAGTGTWGYSGSGLPGPQSDLAGPCQLAPAPEGVYVADSGNHRIRLITPDLRLVDVIGTGQSIAMEAAAPQADATFVSPSACAIDPPGNLVVGDRYRLLIWCKVSGTYFGRSCAAGHVYPIVGRTIMDPSYNGDAPLDSTLLSQIQDLRFDGAGRCWLLEVDRPLVRRLTNDGRLQTLAGDAASAAVKSATVYRGDGVCALQATLGRPVALASLGNDLLVADATHHRIRRLLLSGS